jgi:hypothetical protein
MSFFPGANLNYSFDLDSIFVLIQEFFWTLEKFRNFSGLFQMVSVRLDYQLVSVSFNFRFSFLVYCHVDFSLHLVLRSISSLKLSLR